MSAGNSRAGNETLIRTLMAGWVKAVRAKDVNGVMSNYAPDILLFDLASPLFYRGADAYRRNWEEWFASWKGPLGYEIRDLTVTAGDNVAFSHSLNRISGMRTNEELTDVWVRATACFRKIDDKWLITHEHVSVPFYMDGSDKAATRSQAIIVSGGQTHGNHERHSVGPGHPSGHTGTEEGLRRT